MEIKVHKLLIFIFAFTSLYGCAYSQNISLLDESEVLYSNDSVIIIDNRDGSSKKTKLNPNPICSRWYGDQFIQPSKLEYLKHALNKSKNQSLNLSLQLDIFDTIEYCGYSTSKGIAIATEAAVFANTGVQSYYPIPEYTGGDFFRLRIAGQVNGTAFLYTGEFDYSDLKYISFPSENKEYSKRINNLFQDSVQHILSVAKDNP